METNSENITKLGELQKKMSDDISSIKMLIEKSQRLPYTTKFLQGVVGGFGTVIGATIFVAIFIFVLTQLGHIDLLKPTVERIIDIIQSKR